jgi:hypothetical protein
MYRLDPLYLLYNDDPSTANNVLSPCGSKYATITRKAISLHKVDDKSQLRIISNHMDNVVPLQFIDNTRMLLQESKGVAVVCSKMFIHVVNHFLVRLMSQ